MSASARTAEGGPEDKAREPRGTLGAAPLIEQEVGAEHPNPSDDAKSQRLAGFEAEEEAPLKQH